MAKYFLIGAIVVTLLTAGFGFATKGNVGKLQETLTSTKSNLTSTKTMLSKEESDLKKATEDLTAANKAADDAKSTAASMTAERDAAKKTADEATSQIKDQADKIASLNADIEKLKGANVGMSPEEVAAKVNALQKERDDLKVEVDEQKKVADTLRTKATEETSKLDTVEREVKHYKEGINLHAYQGSITAVNPGWNFVVVNIGDRQGVTPNTPMIISRGGSVIGKVRITSVEPDQSIADVIPGSLPKGVTIQPGDEVIFTGNRPSGGQGATPAGSNPPSGSNRGNSASLPH